MKTRREIFKAHYRHYQQAGKQEKGNVLEEVAGTTGVNRDHLAYGWQTMGSGRRLVLRDKRTRGKPGQPAESGSRGRHLWPC